MNSPAAFHVNTNKNGFTLVELLLVAALMLMMGALLFPLGITFYRAQMLNETGEGIASVLRKAQSFTITGKNDASYGVRFLPDAYVLYEGASYTLRDISGDEVYPLPSTVILSGFEEVHFEPFSGMPSQTGSIDIATGGESVQIEVLTSGVIYY